jgi:molecular chaperone HscA
VFEVLATGGDSALGGDDFDHRILCWIIQEAKLLPLSDQDTRLLMTKARWMKESLTTQVSANIEEQLSSGENVNLTLTRKVFFELTQHLINKTLNAIRRVLHDANMSASQIDGVVLVGGATRMLHVRLAVKDFFGRDPLLNIDPDKVVALGAAIQANLLAGNRKEGDDWLLLDVIPLSLGIETMGGLVEKIIPRNSTIPCARFQEFTTFKDGQTALAVHVVQGERELVTDCRSLARFELRGIPPMVAGAARIRVTYQVDADGLLLVTAKEMHSGVEAHITVKPSYGLTDEEITNMLQDSFSAASVDAAARNLKEEQVEAERVLLSVKSALAEDKDLLSTKEQDTILQLMEGVSAILSGQDYLEIRAARRALEESVEEFAARRMDKNVRLALSGKNVDEINLK